MSQNAKHGKLNEKSTPFGWIKGSAEISGEFTDCDKNVRNFIGCSGRHILGTTTITKLTFRHRIKQKYLSVKIICIVMRNHFIKVLIIFLLFFVSVFLFCFFVFSLIFLIFMFDLDDCKLNSSKFCNECKRSFLSFPPWWNCRLHSYYKTYRKT